jgi:ubiquinone/menaquinone biosynthesis C-methylase UbiE
MPDNEKHVYDDEADQYERLIDREDYQGNILHAIQKIVPEGSLVGVDLGAGTGRLIRLFVPYLAVAIGLDISASMLKVARGELIHLPQKNWLLGQADHRWLPLASHSVDLVLSGWSICYLAVWNLHTWRAELEAALSEIQRVLRPGGCAILLETLGTGRKTPQKPAHLADYFNWLSEKGFIQSWLRTDYHFEDQLEAVHLTRFFFGDEMAAHLVESPVGVILPECTGLWWQRF